MYKIINKAQEAEIYDEIDITPVSSTMKEADIENISVVNDNDGEDTVFLQMKDNDNQTELSDSDIEHECSVLNSHVAMVSNPCKKEEFSGDLTVIPKENRSFVIPDDPKELKTFVIATDETTKATSKFLKQSYLSVEKYNEIHQKARQQGFIALDAALKLSMLIKDIKINKGFRSDLHPNKNFRNKKQILWEDFGLSEKKAARFEHLTAEAVIAEKKFANDKDEIPTITHALKFVEKKKSKQSNENKSLNCDTVNEEALEVLEKKTYDIIYADFGKLDKNFNISEAANDNALLYLWVENSSLPAAIGSIRSYGFNYIDSSVFVKRKIKAGGKYFKNRHAMILVGEKGNFQQPEQQNLFTESSVVYENEVGDNKGYSYYHELIKRRYSDLSLLNLCQPEETQEIFDEVSNDR